MLERARKRTRRPGAVGRASAAELLGAAAHEPALPELTMLLEDRDPDVRSAAARALGKLGDPAAVPALLAALEGRRTVPAGVVTMGLLHIGPTAAASLVDGLDSRYSPAARAIAAELLGRLGGFQAADELIGALRADPDPGVRAAAARALGRMGVPRAVAPLEAVLIEEQVPAVRYSTTWALGELVLLSSGDLVLIAIAAMDVARWTRRVSFAGHDDIFANPLTPGVSVLVPAFNEELSIVESAHAMLAVKYPEFEVIIVDDGSTDATFERLQTAFDLVEVERVIPNDVPTIGAVRSVHAPADGGPLLVVR